MKRTNSPFGITRRPLERRHFLLGASGAAAGFLGSHRSMRDALAATVAADGGGLHAPARIHFEPKARRLLFIFLTGGFSHVDTFDPKPRLVKDHGKPIPAFGLRPDESRPLPLLGSPFKFARRGRSGLEVSELFTHLGEHADDLCVLRTLHTDIVEHFQATLAMHTGSSTIPMPSLGSWLSYGLGSFNPNLPAYVVLAEHLPYAGAQVWDAGFLPPEHQGVRLVPGDAPIPDLASSVRSVRLAEMERILLNDWNSAHAGRHPGDARLPARSRSFETARGMMREAPEVFDLARESDSVLASYGLQRGDNRSFPWQCIVARRLLERGVRVVEVIDTGSHDNWDAHGDMEAHRPKALRVDRALAALIGDLKERGLLQDTLAAVCTEFGRTPWVNNPGGKGRNHYAKAFTCLLAGAGVRGGIAHGETNEYGAEIASAPVHVHDYHATILHLLGIDHTRLTYRYSGRDFRLTDVSGRVVTGILA